MTAGKTPWNILVTAFCLALAFGGVVLVNAAGSLVAAQSLTATSTLPGGGGWRSGGPYGGDVQALALSPAFAADGFALAGGAQTGPSMPGGYGIARTTDNGKTWKLLQDEQHRWAVFDLALSPDFTVDQTAFAGTDVGLFRSTDRGDTWSWLYNGLPDCTHGSSCAIGRVWLSPSFASDGAMLALQRDGKLYNSTNRGDTWTNILQPVVTAAAFSRNYTTNDTLFGAVPNVEAGTTSLMRAVEDDSGWVWEAVFVAPGTVSDILETVEGGLLLATPDGVKLLMPDGAGYSETPTDPPVPGPVSRLATAGDNIYAAGLNGLFISLSFGRAWNRMADTPITPFQAVAPCPLWGSCHAVMAGTRQGVLGTPDDNRQPFAWLPGPSPIPAYSVSASPAYETDSTLFAGTNFGVFCSTDRGLSWQRMTGADSPGYPYGFPTVRVSPAYATDGTVFATVADLARPRATLYKSTDRGVTWTMLPGVTESGVLALSPAYDVDHTLFMASDATLRKSTDDGQSWHDFAMITPAAGFHTLDLEASPAYATDHTVFTTGFGGTLRSTDGGETWTSVGRYSPAYGLAISPNYAADGTAWHTFRAIESAGDGSPESAVVQTTNRGASWSFATSGLPGVYEPYPFPLAASPRYATDKALFTMLSGQFVAGNSHSLYRAIGGGDWWNDLGPAPGNPDGRDLAVTAFSTGRLTAHAATTGGVWHYEAPCEERLAAGGFEGGTAELDKFWQRPSTPATAVYSTKYARSGAQSVRTGIDGTADVYSYSSANQYVTIPASAASVTLDLWWYPISAEGPLAATAAKKSELALVEQALIGNTPDEIMAGDRQYVLILNTDGQVLRSLLWTRSNARAWQQATFDLSAYRGLTVRLAFGTYNDGSNGSSALYADDATITVCWPTPPSPPATPRPPKKTYLPLILRNYTPPLPPPTPTATPTGTPTPTATPNCAFNPPPTPEPLWVDPVTSPTSLLSQTLKVYLGRGREITVSSEAGATIVTGTFSSVTPASVTIPLLPNTTHNLLVQGRVEYSPGCFYTLSTRTARNGAPLVIVQQGPTYTPTLTATSTPTSTPTPIPPSVTPSVCYGGLSNGGFETSAGWIIRSNPVLAAYVSTPAHSGARSMRTGIASGGANVTSYSPIEQAVTFPASLSSAKLSFWRYNVYGDAVAAASADASFDVSTLPRTEAELAAAAPLAADFFYVIAIRSDGSIDWLLTESVNAPTWRQYTVDVSRFRGQMIRFQFGTYNNGTGGISRTFVDDVALQICPPTGALVLPAGWVRRVIGRQEMGTLYAEAGGMLYRSDNAGATWRVSGAAHPEHAVLAADPAVIYAGDGGSCFGGDAPPPTWRTSNGGESWQELPAAKGLKPLAAHPSDARLYLAGCGGPYLSTNGGETVTQQTGPMFGVLDTHRVAPAGGAWQEVWVGGVSEGGGGAVLVSRDGGATWAQSTPLGLQMGWYGDLRLDRTLSGRVYAATYHGFFATQDDGASWQEKSEGLADVIEPGPAGRSYGLLSLAQLPTDPERRFYLGTVRGLYTRSLAESAWAEGAWTKITGQPFDALEISDLMLLDAAPADLYVTTPAGVFIHHLSTVPVPPTPTATATSSPTPTATPTIGAIPTAEPGVWPTPYVLATLNLPAGSRPNGIALDAAGATAYVAFHGVDRSGRTLGVVSADPLNLTSTVVISTQPAGPNQVAVVPRQGMDPLVAVTARQTDELVLVAPPTVHRRLGVGDMPNGVVAAGQYLYAANFGTGDVSIFNRNTLEWAQTLAVGHKSEPSLFAADPEMGDVYLSLHGANKIARLHDLYVASEYSDIPAPYGLALDPASRRLYVANRGAVHTVTVFDLTTGRVMGTIAIGAEPFVLAVNPDTGHLFVACGDHVKVYRTLDWTLVTTIAVPPGAEEGIVVDATSDRIYVTSREGDALTVIQDAAPPLAIFTSNRAGNTEIYSMLPDGREQTRLTTTADSGEGDATGSPDGRWIAYNRVEADGASHLWLMSRDGRNPRQITTGVGQDFHPTWSADGARLAFARYNEGNADIYTLRLADGVVTRLTSGESADLGPDWSWANGRIVFESDRAGPNGEIYTMASDGADVRRITINPNGDAQPGWSPAGDRVVFWGSRAEQTVYRVNADGSGSVPLVSRTLRPDGPHWGPPDAAGWIIFTGYRPGSGHSEVFRITPNGAGLALLTFNEVDFDAATGWLPGAP